MKYPVFGLILILFLQAGFIAYTNADLISRAPIGEVAIDSSNISETEIAAVASQPETDFSVIRTSPVAAKFVRSDRFTTPVKASFIRNVYPATRTIAFQKPVIIRPRLVEPLRRAEPPQSRSYEMSASFSEKPRKKSFLSKAFSVVRKPYDFVKFVGSKLD